MYSVETSVDCLTSDVYVPSSEAYKYVGNSLSGNEVF